VATALDVQLGKGDPVTQLGHAIAGRGSCLVVLDNFEQVVEHAGATVARWLDRAPEARFLVINRERLGLSDEEVLAVEPLDEGAAVELFAARARAVLPGFVVDEVSHPLVVQVVTQLDRLPLCIELGAARLQVLSLEQVAARTGDRFRLLGAGRGRHATLKGAIDGSWQLLLPWERAAFAQVSVFEGGFTLEAAEVVVELDEWPEAPWVIDVLQRWSTRASSGYGWRRGSRVRASGAM
jgi:predicted ATPase